MRDIKRGVSKYIIHTGQRSGHLKASQGKGKEGRRGPVHGVGEQRKTQKEKANKSEKQPISHERSGQQQAPGYGENWTQGGPSGHARSVLREKIKGDFLGGKYAEGISSRPNPLRHCVYLK